MESGKVTFKLPENVEDEKESCYLGKFIKMSMLDVLRNSYLVCSQFLQWSIATIGSKKASVHTVPEGTRSQPQEASHCR